MPTPDPAALAKLDEPRKYRSNTRAKTETTDPDRVFDLTALHANHHGRHTISHSDYIAHCERYDYVIRSLTPGVRLLDVGCGVDFPLLHGIGSRPSDAAKFYKHEGVYVGVDMNPLRELKRTWADALGECDITSFAGLADALRAGKDKVGDDAERPFEGFDLVVCLEVIEHMYPDSGRAMLHNFRDALVPGGRVLMSTPVYDGVGQARNHLHEYYRDELEALILDVGGFTIVKQIGTFMNERDARRWLKANRPPEWLAFYDEVRTFHTSTYMSGFVAPMAPELARNILWELRRD